MRAFVLLTLITAGCGAKSTCVPGQSAACVCSDGTGGAQVCRGDGTFGVCQCASGATSGGTDDMGTSDGTGGNGSGSRGDMATGGSAGQKRVFISSAAYSGPAAGGICQAAADSVNLGGTWVPWLSFGSGVTPTSAIDTIKGTGPWVRLDGMVAFANHAQLATAPSVPLNVDEHGQTVTVSDVWTGTLTGGGYSGSDCHDWSANNYYGSIGRSSSASDWTAYTSQQISCTNTAHVYCFEQ